MKYNAYALKSSVRLHTEEAVRHTVEVLEPLPDMQVRARKAWQVDMIPDTDKAYIAGLFDGEGSVNTYETSYQRKKKETQR